MCAIKSIFMFAHADGKCGARRRAETQDDMSEENFEPTTTQKTPEQTDRIMIGIDQNELLSGCARVVTRRLEWQRCACTHQRLW